jgi:acyl carrier protein
MSEEEIFEKVTAILKNQLSIDNKEVKLESQLIDDLGADSLDLVEISMALEEEFSIEVPDDQVESIHTVEDVVKFIHNNLDN